jgi:cell division protein DivIC
MIFKKILRILLNKYFITTVLFLAWLVFFDSNNVFTRLKFLGNLKELNNEKQFYLDEIKKDSILTQKLMQDSLELEKFAREKYGMKKNKEDVYLIIDTIEDLHQ